MDTTTDVEKVLKHIEKISHEKFVIHGSGVKKSTLVPKKPAPTTRYREHWQKAIYATSFVEIAILYAVVEGDPKWKIVRGKGIHIFMPKEGLTLRDGYVYVCHRKDFKGNPSICLSTKPTRPVKTIFVPSFTLDKLYESKRIHFISSRERT